MHYELSFASFFIGIIILIIGVIFVRFHQWVADNFGGGVSDYEKYRMWAFITCMLGLVVMVNLHAVILGWIVSLIFHG